MYINICILSSSRRFLAYSSVNFLFFVFFLQRGFFSLPEGQYFIEPVQESADEFHYEPHIVYPRVNTDGRRQKRSLGSKETPSPCGVQGVCVNQCVSVYGRGCSCPSVSMSNEDNTVVHCPCFRCAKWLWPGGEGTGGMGEGAAERGGGVAVPLAAFGQQGALGGDHGGGRLQTHRISWQWQCGVLHLHHHEHGEMIGWDPVGGQSGGTGSSWGLTESTKGFRCRKCFRNTGLDCLYFLFYIRFLKEIVVQFLTSVFLQVAGIFHDASIGNAIHVILVRLILLHGEEVKRQTALHNVVLSCREKC